MVSPLDSSLNSKLLISKFYSSMTSFKQHISPNQNIIIFFYIISVFITKTHQASATIRFQFINVENKNCIKSTWVLLLPVFPSRYKFYSIISKRLKLDCRKEQWRSAGAIPRRSRNKQVRFKMVINKIQIINYYIVNFIIHSLANLNMYGLPIYGKTNSYGSTKRIKNYSYNPLDSIGKGFSSVVYKGVNDQNKEPVAIKAIDMKGIRDSAAKQMLQFEIQALTTLNHPNIMKCFDVVKETSHCYVITQLCNGGDLGEMLKRKGRFNQPEASKILKDIVKAYIQIANKGFLHRDLKLANVLMNNGQAKIADFGFAKKCRAQSIKQRYNVGSPLYMSPQALKNNIYSVKNDIWSIGIMAFEMLHGDTPWQCKTEKQLIDKMVRIPVKFRDSLKISNDLKDFIRKCLQVNQSKRMSVEDLKNWLTEQQEYNEQVHNIQNIPTQQPRLTQKTTTFQKLTSRPLSQLTNKVVSNSNNSKSVNKLKSNINLTEVQAKGKEKQRNKDQLSKSVVNFNNNLIIKEIILFRLHFKALQKLKQTNQLPSAPAQLKNILGNQTIRRVTLLKKLICSQQLGMNHHYSLKNIQNYLNPIYNPDIKKYKSVVNEYFNKYTSQIKMQILQGKTSPSQIISSYLKGISGSQIQKQSLLMHWLVNLTKASTSLSKGQLEQILEPKNQINPVNLRQKIQQICV